MDGVFFFNLYEVRLLKKALINVLEVFMYKKFCIINMIKKYSHYE